LSLLTKEIDLRGRFCGENELADKPYKYYLQPNIELNLKICVSSCPTETGPDVCIYSPQGKPESNFCYVQMATLRRGSVCYPLEPSMRKRFYNNTQTVNNILFQVVRDIFLSKDSFLLEGFVGILIFLLFFRLLRVERCIQSVVWVPSISVFLVLIGLGVMSRSQYFKTIDEKCLFEIDRYNCGKPFSLIYLICSYSLFGLSVIWLIFLGLMFNKMELIVALIKEMTNFTDTFWKLEWVPFLAIIPSFAYSMIIVYSLAMCFGVATLTMVPAEYIQGGKTKEMVYNSNTIYYIFIPICWFYWVILRTGVNLCRYIVAYTLSKWYFAKKKHSIRLEFTKAISAIFSFHLGTVIYISLVEIFFMPVKSVFRFIVLKILRGDSFFKKLLQCILYPCILIHFKISRFIDPRSLVLAAVFSTGYSASAQKAYFLLEKRNKKRNFGPLGILKTTLDILRLSVASIMTLVYLLRYYYAPKNAFLDNTDNVYYPFFVGIALFWMIFTFLKIFRTTFVAIYQTMLTCYFIDEEMFVTYQRFSEKILKNFVPFFDIYGRKVEYYQKSKNIKSKWKL
jgi:hypothetical protein